MIVANIKELLDENSKFSNSKNIFQFRKRMEYRYYFNVKEIKIRFDKFYFLRDKFHFRLMSRRATSRWGEFAIRFSVLKQGYRERELGHKYRIVQPDTSIIGMISLVYWIKLKYHLFIFHLITWIFLNEYKILQKLHK